MIFLWLLVFNLKLPMLLVSLTGIGLSSFIGYRALQRADDTVYASPENSNARFTQMTCLQSGVILAVFCALLWAVPSPTYDVRYVEKPVPFPVVKSIRYIAQTRTIVKPPLYSDVFEQCSDSLTGTGTRKAYKNISDDEARQCHLQALEATSPSRIVTRTVEVHDSYKTLFDDCNDFSLVGIKADALAAKIRNERLKICHDAALAGSHDH